MKKQSYRPTQIVIDEVVGYTELHDAIQRNQMHKFQLLVRQFEVNATDINGNTPIFLAILEPENGLELIKLLVENGANINHKNNIDQTALHWAVLEQDQAMVQYLIENGADIFQKDVMRRSALHFASENEVNKQLQSFLTNQFVTKLDQAIASIDNEQYRLLLSVYFKLIQKNYGKHPEKFATLATELATVVHEVPKLLHDGKNVEAKSVINEFYQHSSSVLADKKALRVLGIITLSLLALASGAAIGLAAGSAIFAGITAFDTLVGVTIAGFTASQALVSATTATFFAATALAASTSPLFGNDKKAAEIKDNAIAISA